MCYKLSCAHPSELVSGRENPAVKAGLFRVYGQWDNYRTNLEDFLELYLLGIQVDMVLSMGTGHKEYLNTQ